MNEIVNSSEEGNIMKTERRKLVTYSIDIDLPRQVGDSDVADPTRFALGHLLMSVGKMILDGEPELGVANKLTLELETQGWNQCFRMTIEKIDE